ncbi:MAG: ATP-binding protein, partial [Planctomycetota bacterium]
MSQRIAAIPLRWRLLASGLLCSLVAALAGGAGLYSLNKIHSKQATLTRELKRKIALQQSEVIDVIRHRRIASRIQEALELPQLESIFLDMAGNVKDHETHRHQGRHSNGHKGTPLANLYVRKHNLLVARAGLRRQYAIISEMLDRIGLNALSTMDDVEFDASMAVEAAFERAKTRRRSHEKAPLVDIGRITQGALSSVKASLRIYADTKILEALTTGISVETDADLIRYREKELQTLLRQAQSHLDQLPDSQPLWNIRKRLAAFGISARALVEARARLAQQKTEFLQATTASFQMLEAWEQETLKIAADMERSAGVILDDSSHHIRFWQNMVVGLVAVAFLFVVLIGLATSRSVQSQLGTLNRGIRLAAQGELDTRVNTGTRDEIGELSRAFDAMTATLKSRMEELSTAKQAAEQASIAKSQFLANMSHEVRTPMNGVLGLTDILLETELNEVQREHANGINRSAKALLTVINDILDFSKVEAGMLSLHPITCNLELLTQELSEFFASVAEEKGVSILLRYPPSTPKWVSADPGRIRQILTNLVGNAVKFTQAGHVLVDISGTTSGGHANLSFRIEDTGIGIAQDDLQGIFHAFTQADTSSTRRFGGTGLGLAISRQLSQLMGGELSATSTVGQGSTFIFTVALPLADPPKASITPKPELSGLRALIVDDNEINRRIQREYLESWGVVCDCAVSGANALHLIQQAQQTGKPYRIVLLDYSMPGQDGLAVGQAIRQHPEFAPIGLILLTSMAMRGDADRFREAGFDAYLPKPLRASLLQQAIEETVAAAEKGTLITSHTLRERQASSPGATSPYSQGATTFTARTLVVDDQEINRMVTKG